MYTELLELARLCQAGSVGSAELIVATRDLSFRLELRPNTVWRGGRLFVICEQCSELVSTVNGSRVTPPSCGAIAVRILRSPSRRIVLGNTTRRSSGEDVFNLGVGDGRVRLGRSQPAKRGRCACPFRMQWQIDASIRVASEREIEFSEYAVRSSLMESHA